MTDKATLNWSVKENGDFEFTLQADSTMQPVESWCLYEVHHENGIGCVNALFRDEDLTLKPTIDDKKVFCSSVFIASLTELEVKQLGLPTPSQAKIKIKSKGLITQPNFEIGYTLLRSDGRPFLGLKRDGLFIKAAGQTETLLDPIYGLINNIDSFNNTSFANMDERFVAWGEIQELLPEDAVIDGQLNNITICRADRFTLDVTSGGGFNPVLIRHNEEKNWEEESQSDINYAVPKVRQKEFEKQFKNWNSVKSNYPIGHGTYVVLPKRVTQVLSVVKGYQFKPTEERLSFISNPQKYINEKLEEQQITEELGNLFVETPEFISQRIANIGIWEPKLCAYKVERQGDWLPEDGDRLLVPIGNLLVNISTNDLKQLLNETVEALDCNQPYVQYQQHQIPATIETKNTIIKLLKPYDLPGEPGDTHTQKVVAPILKDNIEDLEFDVIKHKPRPQIERIAQRLKTTSLFDHQQYGLEWLAKHWESGSIGALLADDMGLGKTLQTLAFLVSIKEQMEERAYPQKPFLIVAPSGLLKNWEDEANLHLHQPGLGNGFKAFGDSIRQLQNLTTVERTDFLSKSDWVLTTYETLRDKITYFLSVDWGVSIFDEAQKIKNPTSRVTEMAKSLSSDFTLLLTGTPVENELKDLWCIVDTAQPGLFGSLREFHDNYAKPAEHDPSEAQRLKEVLVEKTSPPLMLRRLKEDHIKGLPAKNIKEVVVQMPPLQAEEYENIVKDAQEYRSKKGGVLKFIQLVRKASLVAEEFDINGINDGVVQRSARLTALMEILDGVANQGEKALVFCESLDVQQHLAGYIQQRYQLPTRPMRIHGGIDGATRKKYVDIFQSVPDGEFDVMLLSPKAGGVGLTITAANNVIHLTRWWNPAVEDQSTDRVYRIGQKRAVNVFIPIAEHPKYKDRSFDMNLNRLLNQKRNLSHNALIPGTVTNNDIQDLFEQTIE
ncbi:DEAD/DEAH box helicase [Shewanella insulae]|uniref:DEAD/DEAH box helicase n=1 Tax=Shewanella insulae TaxID=2681496 RepID=UPI001EFDC17D|nr:DEAD/DEAH box helicase [Shewanella insulae]MCG9714954.1 DEAD/DEAH box helicase [Shewanella insulae]